MSNLETLKHKLASLQADYDNIVKLNKSILDNPSNDPEFEYMKNRDTKYWESQLANIKRDIGLVNRQIKAARDEQRIMAATIANNIKIPHVSLNDVLMDVDIRYSNKYNRIRTVNNIVTEIEPIAWINLFEPCWDIYANSNNKSNLINNECDYADAIATKYTYYSPRDEKIHIKKVENLLNKFPNNCIEILEVGIIKDGCFVDVVELCEQNGTLWMSARIGIHINKYMGIGDEILSGDSNEYEL